MGTEVYTHPTQDEFITAALAHFGGLIPYAGVAFSIIIWLAQRGESRFAAFQALQAVACQLAFFLALLVGMGCYAGSLVVILLIAPQAESSADALIATTLIPFGILGLIGLGFLGYMIYAIIAALSALQGKELRYAIIGGQVEGFLQKK